MAKLVQFNKSLRYIKTSGKVLANHVQLAIVDLADHVKDCGDWSQINELDKALVKCTSGLKVLGFREYVKDVFTGLKYDEKAQVWLRKAKKKPVVIDEKVLNNEDKVEVFGAQNEYSSIVYADGYYLEMGLGKLKEGYSLPFVNTYRTATCKTY